VSRHPPPRASSDRGAGFPPRRLPRYSVLASGQGGTFRTLSLSQHARANAEIVQLFRDVTIDINQHGRDDVEVPVVCAVE
jgi:hypothetical protein